MRYTCFSSPLPFASCLLPKTQSRTSDNTDNQRITNGDLPVALDFTTEMPTAADITTEVGIKQLVQTMEGASNQGTNQKGATATNPSISMEVNVEQYRDEENWTVDFFVSHKPRTFGRRS